MSRSTIPTDKEQDLEAALNAVSEIEEGFEKVLTDAVNAKADDEIEYAKAFLKAEGTEKAREAQAKIDTERFKRERYRTEAVREFQRTKLQDAQAAVSARQTLLKANLRTNEAF